LKNRTDISPETLKNLLTDENGTPPSVSEIQKTEDALKDMANQHAQPVSSQARERILAKMKKLNHQAQNRQPFTLDNLPMLTPDANWLDWEEAVKGIEAPDDYENIHLHLLLADETRSLFVAFVQEYIPEEVHHDILESFILLDGTCECHIWTDDAPDAKRLVRMQAGDFIEMKIGENHDIVVTSPQPMRGILQWLIMAA
jgi:mannose-6-phosphate isomerase-like protein (cupin superfamily)